MLLGSWLLKSHHQMSSTKKKTNPNQTKPIRIELDLILKLNQLDDQITKLKRLSHMIFLLKPNKSNPRTPLNGTGDLGINPYMIAFSAGSSPCLYNCSHFF